MEEELESKILTELKSVRSTLEMLFKIIVSNFVKPEDEDTSSELIETPDVIKTKLDLDTTKLPKSYYD